MRGIIDFVCLWSTLAQSSILQADDFSFSGVAGDQRAKSKALFLPA